MTQWYGPTMGPTVALQTVEKQTSSSKGPSWTYWGPAQSTQFILGVTV